MPDYQTYKFETYPGLPPLGEAGSFFGFDRDDNAFILRWNAGHYNPCWAAIGFDPVVPQSGIHSPLLFLCIEENLGRIVKWAHAPAPRD